MGRGRTVEQTLLLYAWHFDQAEVGQAAALFVAEGQLIRASGEIVQGRDVIRDFMAGVRAEMTAQRVQPRHFITNILVDQSGQDFAVATCYMSIMRTTPAGRVHDHIGYYEDELVQHDDAWFFQRRRIHADGL